MAEPIYAGVTSASPSITAYSSRLPRPWKMSEAGIKFLEGWEAFSATLYDHDGSKQGNATIGYGHLVHLGKISGAPSETPFLKRITGEEAEKLLKSDLVKTERTVNGAVTCDLYQFEYDALTCFTYNLQNKALPLLDFVNKGDYKRVGDEMRQYGHSGGRVVKGLFKRRHREAEMFEAGVYDSSH